MRISVGTVVVAWLGLAVGSVLLAEPVERSDGSLELRLHTSNVQEGPLVRANLVRVSRFVLEQGQKRSYSSMFGSQFFHATGDYAFFLVPDTYQENIESDPAKSGFHILWIDSDSIRDRREIDFSEPHTLYVRASYPPVDMTVAELRRVAEEAVAQLLEAIDAAEAEGAAP